MFTNAFKIAFRFAKAFKIAFMFAKAFEIAFVFSLPFEATHCDQGVSCYWFTWRGG